MARRGDKGKSEGLSRGEKVALLAVHIVDRAFDLFGVPMTILFGSFLAVYKLGSKQTHDDFIRELLFGSVTNTPWLRLFFVGLIGLAIFMAVKARKRGRALENDEMQRLADQKTQLQEQLAGKELSHSTPPPEGSTKR